MSMSACSGNGAFEAIQKLSDETKLNSIEGSIDPALSNSIASKSSQKTSSAEGLFSLNSLACVGATAELWNVSAAGHLTKSPYSSLVKADGTFKITGFSPADLSLLPFAVRHVIKISGCSLEISRPLTSLSSQTISYRSTLINSARAIAGASSYSQMLKSDVEQFLNQTSTLEAQDIFDTIDNLKNDSSAATMYQQITSLQPTSLATVHVAPPLVRPVVNIQTGPQSLSQLTSASVSFSVTPGSKPVQKIECQLDGNSFSVCVSPVHYFALTQGQHVVSIRAIDSKNNSSVVREVHFGLDQTAPVLAILTAPSGSVSDTSATISFSATDTGGATLAGYECRLDSANFAACTSPLLLSGLTAGPHNFSVRAIDSVGNVSSTQSATWTVLSVGAATRLAFTVQPSTSGLAGSPLVIQPVVSVLDQVNAVVTSSTMAISLSLHSNSDCSSAVILNTPNGAPSLKAATFSAVSGRALFSNLQIDIARPQLYLKASAAGVLSACSSMPTVINPASADGANSTISASPNNVAADGEAESVLTFHLKDRYGNSTPSQSVSFQVSSSTNHTLSASSPVVTDANGRATVSLASTLPDTKIIQITSPVGGPSTNVNFQIAGCPSPIWVDAKYTGGHGVSNGTFLRPWTTVAHVNAAMTTGACFLFREGVYEALNGLGINNSGRNRDNMTFAGIQGEVVHWTVGQPLTGWTTHQNLAGGVTVYKTNIGASEISDLMVDFVSTRLAHYPREGWLEIPNTVVQGAPVVINSTTFHPYSFTDSRLSNQFPNLVGSTLMAKVTSTNTTARYRIAAFDPAVGTVTTDRTTAAFASGDRYVFTNTVETIQENEWAQTWDAGTSTYTVYFATSDAAKLNKIRGSKSSVAGMTISPGTQGITIKNMIFTGGGWGIYTFGSNINILNNIFTSVDYGIFLRGVVGTPDAPAVNTLIRDNLFIGNLIALNSTGPITGTKFIQNEVAFGRSDGISLGGGHVYNTEISRNFIHHYNQQISHADGFQLVYATTASVQPSTNFVADSNVFWMGGQHFGLGIAGSGHEIKNNLMLNAAAYSTLNGYLSAGTQNYYKQNTYALNIFGPYNSFAGGTFHMSDNVYDLRNGTNFAFSRANGATLGELNHNLYSINAQPSVFFWYVPSGAGFTYSGQANSGVAKFYQDYGFEQFGAVSWGGSVFANMPKTTSTLNDVSNIFVTNTRQALSLARASGFANGDYIEINADGVLRRIVSISAVAGYPSGARIVFTPELPEIPFTADAMVDNWGPTLPTSLQRDTRLTLAAAQTMSSNQGMPGSSLSMAKIQSGILDGGTKRTLPLLPASMQSAMLNPNTWSPYLLASPKPPAP